MLLLGGAPPSPLPGPGVVGVITCPDCGAAAVELVEELVHQRSCPLGRALDERIAADWEWFAGRPWANEYYRAPDPSELAELRWKVTVPGEGGDPGRVMVHRLAPGVLLRRYGDVVIVSTAVTR